LTWSRCLPAGRSFLLGAGRRAGPRGPQRRPHAEELLDDLHEEARWAMEEEPLDVLLPETESKLEALGPLLTLAQMVRWTDRTGSGGVGRHSSTLSNSWVVWGLSTTALPPSCRAIAGSGSGPRSLSRERTGRERAGSLSLWDEKRSQRRTGQPDGRSPSVTARGSAGQPSSEKDVCDPPHRWTSAAGIGRPPPCLTSTRAGLHATGACDIRPIRRPSRRSSRSCAPPATTRTPCGCAG
jgi:hypothetical protein